MSKIKQTIDWDDPDTYEAGIICGNCGHIDYVFIPRGKTKEEYLEKYGTLCPICKTESLYD